MKITVIQTNRKTVSLSVNDDLNVVVRAPYNVPKSEIEKFVAENEIWIENAVRRKKKSLEFYDLSDKQIEELKKKALSYIPQRVEYFANIMKLYPTGIKITSAKKRFGSCSSKNSLCFSLYLMLYSQKAIDYVVVHELAHIKYHNHSKEFYLLIEKYLPDYKEREKLLKIS
ncbi:MAG: M48 family metallopeptidase [Clostridiales bacterium]|nr:M48 family metallopeptidase [Clostridiales bacterium]